MLHISDIDECDTAPCPELAMCVNTFGGFECFCDGPGFTGDGTETCEGRREVLCVVSYYKV